MADQARRGRNRPDSRQMWDESDRRNRGPGARDRRDNRDRQRDDGPRDRDRRYRSRSRSPQTGGRRDGNRSHSLDRRDRDRDSDKNKPREPERTRGRGRDSRRDDGRRDRPRNREDEYHPTESAIPKGISRDKVMTQVLTNNADAIQGPARHSNPRRSASPTRSPLGKSERSAQNSPLPTRSKPGDRGTNSSLSFKVGKHDDDTGRGSRGKGREKDDKRETPEHDTNLAKERKDTPGSEGEAMDEDEDEDLVVEDDGLSAMQAMMGFGGFGTTKGTKVAGNNAGAIRKEKKTEYRQYMNRVGGFNRPLSPGR
ncbi:Uu.00g094100.m01.CDS01 [Anthostomella pinea]|uniref:Uu.00g094100.m01.CDS01 n=1 Tax=Anthostomella pinea TaxID=933095 RepID=A0AAI8VNM9_9PEZI|nr:Uu.00g094100.m01.CDS01 [Anthostomella pinea]